MESSHYEFIGVVLVLMSVFETAGKSIWSPILGMTAAFPLGMFAILNEAWFLLILQFILFGLQSRVYIHWKKK